MFKETRKHVVITKFFKQYKYMSIFGKYFDAAQSDFLKRNWYSIDAIEISFQPQKTITFYEVKTKNSYNLHLGFKLKVTYATHVMYSEAKQLGFVVKLAMVVFEDDWNYSVELKEFDPSEYCIDKPKKYDCSNWRENPGGNQ